MSRITLGDIARELGVSKSLVSFVLNGRGNAMRISAELQEKVKKKSKELGYKPNQLARGLRKGKTDTIGLVIPDISNPFFAKITRAVENEAKANGYNVIFCSSDESKEFSRDSIELLKDRQVEGLILVPTYNFLEEISMLKEEKFPFVLIDRYFHRLKTNSITIDNYSATKQAINHLISLGHKKIGCLSFLPHFLHIQDRVDGYKDALKEAGIELNPKWLKNLPYDHMEAEIESYIEQMTSGEDKLDAIYFSANVIGMTSMEYINRKKIKIPEDLSIICFDDPEALRIFQVPITTIRQPTEEIGSQAVKILLDDIKNDKSKQNIYQTVQLDADFIIRESCGKGRDSKE